MSAPGARGTARTGDLPPLPALVDGAVHHHRRFPVEHRFRHRCYLWLVDLDALPRLPWHLRPVAGFRSRDHLGGTTTGRGARSIKDNVTRFLARRGVELGTGGRIVMLANARVLGHVFNPLSVFWCFTADGDLRCVVAEVHNTYGQRHAYLLEPDDDGLASTGKVLYVSPFNPVAGRYELRFRLDRDRVDIAVRLVHGGHPAFEAGFEGSPAPATDRSLTLAFLRRPMMSQRVSLLIRAHGWWLWARGLPLVPRPAHLSQEDVG